ncbi:aldehyde dehydrogenase family protein [Elusimicrobiota bacterium]
MPQAEALNTQGQAKAKDEVISYNPATMEEIGRVKNMSREEVLKEMENAKKAYDEWAALSYRERGSFILRARAYLLEHLDELAEAISKDNGKPKVEALASDVLPICDLMQYFAHNTGRVLAPHKLNIGVWEYLLRSSYMEYHPLGVVGIIAPWNFPFSIPMGQIVMALMAGNCVLFKPSSSTPIVGAKIEEVFKAANLPDGVFTHLSGKSHVGSVLVESGVDKIFFTGSVGIGKKVMEMASKNLTPLNLELGGKCPMIVCEDADLEIASSGAVWGAFFNCGQVCASVERVYVHHAIAEKFISLVVKKTKKLRLGEGTNPDIDVGPLTTEGQLECVVAHVEDAKKRGAKILTGGEKEPSLKGYFYKPTVITGIDHSFACVKEETFGPTMPIMTFRTEEEAIRLANDTTFGLTASVWTKSSARGKSIARRVRAGTVMVNNCSYTHAICQTPWGGSKESGFGRSHSNMGLFELVEPHHVHVNGTYFMKEFWWFGYGKGLYAVLKKLSCTLTEGSLWGLVKALPSLIRGLLLPKY